MQALRPLSKWPHPLETLGGSSIVRSLRRLGATTPLPLLDVLFLSLGIAAAMVAALLPGFAVAAWRDGWWTRGARAAFTVLSVSAVVFAAWLNAWNLLGFRY